MSILFEQKVPDKIFETNWTHMIWLVMSYDNVYFKSVNCAYVDTNIHRLIVW